MKYIMFEHAGSGNHGCEAIVRSTMDLLGNNEYFLQSLNVEEDKHYLGNEHVKLIESKTGFVDRNSYCGLIMRMRQRLSSKYDYDILESLYRHSELLKKNSIALSIGGDNYCYYATIDSMRDKLRAFSFRGIPCVLWGCSIDQNFLNEWTKNDLSYYSLITARESLTLEYLENIGLRDNVILCSDPAFTLRRQETNWKNDIFLNYEVVGINISDFMKYYNAYPDATYRNFRKLIDYLLENTDSYIALIPHVCQINNNDLIPIKQLASTYNNERILVEDEDYNCMQIKDIIAKCKVFIGCRTHSTIAAYSSGVPTLVVGYSVKARGIAKDIFGNYEDYLVDVREFTTDDDLLKLYLSFKEKEREIRSFLNITMPNYINRAYFAKNALTKLKL